MSLIAIKLKRIKKKRVVETAYRLISVLMGHAFKLGWVAIYANPYTSMITSNATTAVHDVELSLKIPKDSCNAADLRQVEYI